MLEWILFPEDIDERQMGDCVCCGEAVDCDSIGRYTCICGFETDW